ncbi:MAG: tRNA 2-thiouridine(34) synthase MnmA [Desulfotalea sp.]|nr:MAG: tRNA 2-thiouridine(34) synthase MnmA [Desulfotalea sp.]
MKIGIAMSGGVDSTACALMLREKHQVKGYFMRLAQPDFSEQKVRVEAIASRLGIELHIIDLRKEFDQAVLDYFSGSYFKGLTPNPCVICNKEIKFGLFLDAILEAGMEKMATGHYARVVKNDTLYKLKTGLDPKKDQSYFLARLNQQQLDSVLFPLGDKEKDSIYEYVEENGFNHFRGQESQDVCFLEKNQISNFLDTRNTNAMAKGAIVSTKGKILGEHTGLFHYTIGQRKGLGISSPEPLYVIGLDPKNDTVIVGTNDELFSKTIQVTDLHWLSGTPPDLDQAYNIRIRYSHRGSLAHLEIRDKTCGTFTFSEPQRAITPGQFAVVYNNTELLGSGIIA